MAKQKPRPFCYWTTDQPAAWSESEAWRSDCDNLFEFTADGPTDVW